MNGHFALNRPALEPDESLLPGQRPINGGRAATAEPPQHAMSPGTGVSPAAFQINAYVPQAAGEADFYPAPLYSTQAILAAPSAGPLPTGGQAYPSAHFATQPPNTAASNYPAQTLAELTTNLYYPSPYAEIFKQVCPATDSVPNHQTPGILQWIILRARTAVVRAPWQLDLRHMQDAGSFNPYSPQARPVVPPPQPHHQQPSSFTPSHHQGGPTAYPTSYAPYAAPAPSAPPPPPPVAPHHMYPSPVYNAEPAVPAYPVPKYH